MDLERELRTLDVAWPETPAFRFELVLPARRRRWPVAVALAVVLAVAAAFAVPQSRGAILRFLHLRGVTIERVETLPPAQERPLAAGLGPASSAAAARRALGRPPLLPAVAPTLHVSAQGVVSFLFVYRGGTVLVSELAGDVVLFKKIAGGATHVEGVPHGLWLTGAPHVFLFPGAPPRLAGDVLLVERDGLLLRLEGRGLTKDAALGAAGSLGP